MKRFHVNLSVKNIAESVRFYSALFDAEPVVRKDDYAKWMLDDPRINFAISERGNHVGVNHLGVQVDSTDELTAMRAQLARADQALIEHTGATCCYANSDKYWVTDPTGIAWETFHTLNAIAIYGTDSDATATRTVCCAPANATASAACGELADKPALSCCA